MRTHVDEEGVDLLLPAFDKLVTVVFDNLGSLVPSLLMFFRRELLLMLVPATLHGLICGSDKHKQST